MPGRYLYIEASSPRRMNDKARIMTKVSPQTSGVCVTFYYHMYGTGMGTLILHTMSGGAITGDVWSMSGNQGNSWKLAQATVQSNSPYQVCLCLFQFVCPRFTFYN